MELKKLCIFDFDGTLVDTMLPDNGKKIWKEKTGTDWPYRGWWGRGESLNIDLFDHPVVESTIDAYNEVMGDDEVMVIMMTGRMAKLKTEVQLILQKHNLEFDAEFYNTGGETFSVKEKQIKQLLNDYPAIKEVFVYEDRPEHITRFTLLGKELINSGLINNLTVHVVETKHFNN